MKKIFITEEQLDEILSYLNSGDSGIKNNDYDSEIFVNDKIGDGGISEPTTTDKISKQRCPRTYFGARKTHSTINCSVESKETLNETNSDLVDKKYRIPNKIYSTLKSNLNNSKTNIKGSKRLNNLVNMREISTNEMYRLLNNFNTIEKNSEEYNLLGGDEMKRWIELQLKNAKNASRDSKYTKKELGFDNAFLKKHNKTANNGGAHTKKNNTVKFTYES